MITVSDPNKFLREKQARLTRHDYESVVAAAEDVKAAVAEYRAAVDAAAITLAPYQADPIPFYPETLLPLVHLLEKYAPEPGRGRNELYPITEWRRIACINRRLATRICRQIQKIRAAGEAQSR